MDSVGFRLGPLGVAIAASESLRTTGRGMLEAAALLNEGAPAVLLVITEEQPPEAYASWIVDVPFPYALGLLLTPGDEWQLELTPGTVQANQTQWPHALNLLRTLLTEQGACQHAWKNRVWNWQRKS